MVKEKGLSLIELLVTLAILASLGALGIPLFADFVVKNRVDNEMYRLSKALQVARNTSINSGNYVTLCPITASGACDNDWSAALTVFIDSNNNKILEPNLNEIIVIEKPAVYQGDELKYAKLRVGVTYSPTGRLSGWGQNGTFKYCPINHVDKARGIVVATSGRFYQTYQNTKGIDQTRTYKTIHCS